jgi:peroxiredoxin
MPLRVGDVAPPVDLPDHRGGRWRLEEHRGGVVVLVFYRHLA